jgi:hypothetical protein
MSYLGYYLVILAPFVIPACLESFLKKDPGQARMTENWKNSRQAGVPEKETDCVGHL